MALGSFKECGYRFFLLSSYEAIFLSLVEARLVVVIVTCEFVVPFLLVLGRGFSFLFNFSRVKSEVVDPKALAKYMGPEVCELGV